jgi:hypothetical protein
VLGVGLVLHLPRGVVEMESFERTYPHIARWIKIQGWIEVGSDGMSPSWIRALDEGGMVWEGGDPSKSLDEVFEELDAALAKWMKEAGLE